MEKQVPLFYFVDFMEMMSDRFDSYIKEQPDISNPTATHSFLKYLSASKVAKYLAVKAGVHDSANKKLKKHHAQRMAEMLESAKTLELREFPNVASRIKYLVENRAKLEQEKEEGHEGELIEEILKKKGTYTSILEVYENLLEQFIAYLQYLGYGNELVPKEDHPVSVPDIVKWYVLQSYLNMTFDIELNKKPKGAIDGINRRRPEDFDRLKNILRHAMVNFRHLSFHHGVDFLSKLQEAVYLRFIPIILKNISKYSFDKNTVLCMEKAVLKIKEEYFQTEEILYQKKAIQALSVEKLIKYSKQKKFEVPKELYILARKLNRAFKKSDRFQIFDITDKQEMPALVFNKLIGVYTWYLNAYKNDKSLVPSDSVSVILGIVSAMFTNADIKTTKKESASSGVSKFSHIIASDTDLIVLLFDLIKKVSKIPQDLKEELHKKNLPFNSSSYNGLLEATRDSILPDAAWALTIGYNDKIVSKPLTYLDCTKSALLQLRMHINMILNLYGKSSDFVTSISNFFSASFSAKKYSKYLENIEDWIYRLSAIESLRPRSSKLFVIPKFDIHQVKEVDGNAIIFTNPDKGKREIYFIQAGELLMKKAVVECNEVPLASDNYAFKFKDDVTFKKKLIDLISESDYDFINENVDGFYCVPVFDLKDWEEESGRNVILDEDDNLHFVFDGKMIEQKSIPILTKKFHKIKETTEVTLKEVEEFLENSISEFYPYKTKLFLTEKVIQEKIKLIKEKQFLVRDSENFIHFFKNGDYEKEPMILYDMSGFKKVKFGELEKMQDDLKGKLLAQLKEEYIKAAAESEFYMMNKFDLEKLKGIEGKAVILSKEKELFFLENGKLITKNKIMKIKTDKDIEFTDLRLVSRDDFLNGMSDMSSQMMSKILHSFEEDVKFFITPEFKESEFHEIEKGFVLTKDNLYIIKNGKIEPQIKMPIHLKDRGEIERAIINKLQVVEQSKELNLFLQRLVKKYGLKFQINTDFYNSTLLALCENLLDNLYEKAQKESWPQRMKDVLEEDIKNLKNSADYTEASLFVKEQSLKLPGDIAKMSRPLQELLSDVEHEYDVKERHEHLQMEQLRMLPAFDSTKKQKAAIAKQSNLEPYKMKAKKAIAVVK